MYLLSRQVDAMEGVCHFHMRAAKEAGMVSENSTKVARHRLSQYHGGQCMLKISEVRSSCSVGSVSRLVDYRVYSYELAGI